MSIYKVGDHVVHGRELGKVSEIIKEGDKSFYRIQSLSDPTLSVKTPFELAQKRIRPIISRKEAECLIDRIIDIEPIETDTRTVEAAYTELITSGKHEDIVRLIKTSYLRGAEKTSKGLPRNEKDKMFFRMAEKLLYSEFAIALGKDYDDIKEYVIERVGAAAHQTV